MKMILSPLHLLIGAAVLAVIVYIWARGARGAAESLSKSATQAAGGLVIGTTKGISETFGIPDTDPAKCERDARAGNWLDATFSCSVPDLVRNLFKSEPVNAPPVYGEKSNPSVISFPVGGSLF